MPVLGGARSVARQESGWAADVAGICPSAFRCSAYRVLAPPSITEVSAGDRRLSVVTIT